MAETTPHHGKVSSRVRVDSSTNERILRPLSSTDQAIAANTMKKNNAIVTIVYVFLVLLGVGTGYLLSSTSALGVNGKVGAPIDSPKVVGVTDAAFKDCATGVLEKEGFEGEGTHKLIREGGPSQTAYLISSVVDMDQYVALTVKVCGQTVAAKNVSWLMDVGRLEVQ